MKARRIVYAGIILFPFFFSKSKAQNRERHRSVTINQTVVDGKVVASDTIITYTDTTTRTINSKEVSMEVPYTKSSTVYIDNSYRKLNIRQSKDGKVRLVTTAFYYGEPSFTNEQWLEKLNIQMKNTDSGISIVSGGISSRNNSSAFSWDNGSHQTDAQKFDQLFSSLVPKTPTPPSPPTTSTTQNGVLRGVTINGRRSGSTATTQSGGLSDAAVSDWWGSVAGSARGFSSSGNTAVFDERGNNVYTSNSLRRELTIYIPLEAKLNVVSKYADITVDHDLKNPKIKVINGSLDMVNADNAIINSNYSNVSCGNLTSGDITLTTGKLSLKNAGQLTLNTKYAKVEIDNCNVITIKSTADDYDLDVVKHLNGTQTYGKLRIDKLDGSFDLKGTSADVKIRNIEPSVSFITFDSKYSDVRFPVSNLKNYEVIFAGNYSSVFAPFERRDTTMERKTDESDAFTYTTSNGSVISKIKPGTAPAGQNGTVQRNDDTRIIYTTTDGSVVSTVRPAGATTRSHTNNFVATVGDTKGTHTKFNLTCTSCNVDFK